MSSPAGRAVTPPLAPAPTSGLSLGTARLCILASAVLFSTGGAAIKLTTLSGAQVAGLRSLVAACALWLVFRQSRRGYGLPTLLVGLTYASTMVLFVLANKLTTAASTIFLQSTAPLWVMLAGPWLLKEPIERRDIGFIGAVALGLVLFFFERTPQATAPNPPLGNVLACASGVAWAGTIMGLRWLHNEGRESLTALVTGNVIAGLVCLPWALTGEPALSQAGLSDFVAVLYLGVVQIGLAYLLLTLAMRTLPALDASLLILLEPSLSPLWALWLQGEVPGLPSIAGGLLLLGSSILRALGARRREAT
ncbi:MAG: DMT family transporter [Polyangiaceae bacterium]|nr:DMT family transporter [Polyangiaceae bacterium]